MKIPEPALVADPERDLYWLKEQYRIHLPIVDSTLEVDSGVYTDGASIPRPLWSVIGHPFSPKLIAPAFVHDMLYCSESFERDVCDKIFYELLLEDNFFIKSETIYLTVRTFGWITTWRGHTEESVADARTKVRII